MADLAQQALHQSRPAVAVGLDDEGQFAQQVAAAQLVAALLVTHVRSPAVVDQDALVAREDADLFDRLPTALAVRELHGQGAVGDDMEPLGLAGDPESGLIDMQGRALQEMGHGDLLPGCERILKAPDIAETGRLGELDAGDRVHERDGTAQGQHLGDQQVEDQGLDADTVLHGTRHEVWEPALGPGPALRAFLDLGVDAALDDFEHDVVEDAALPIDGVDVVEVGAASVAGLDGDRLLDGGRAPVTARLRVRLRALAVAPGAPRALVRVRLGRRQTGVPARLARGLLQEHGQQQLEQHQQAADERLALRGDLALRAEILEPLLEGVDLLAQGGAGDARHPDASTARIAARTANRSPSGIVR